MVKDARLSVRPDEEERLAVLSERARAGNVSAIVKLIAWWETGSLEKPRPVKKPWPVRVFAPRPCRQCGAVFQPTHGVQRVCGAACRIARQAAAAKGYNAARRRPRMADRTCDDCGEMFTPWRDNQRFCSQACSYRCRQRAYYAQKREAGTAWNDRRRDNAQRRRARKQAAATGAAVLLAEIRERDKNRCGLCGRVVGTRPWPDPLSASLDHIVPLSEGGAHDPANVHLAHLGCNLAKGARGGGEQLRLMG
jgi:5-methylcytosine-specific restriction endonuclease McrA